MHNGYVDDDEIGRADMAADEPGMSGDYADVVGATRGSEEDGDVMYQNGVPGDESDGEMGITEEDAWTVISSHFQQRGLVAQQLDSFDVFMTNTMQVSSYFSHCVTVCDRLAERW